MPRKNNLRLGLAWSQRTALQACHDRSEVCQGWDCRETSRQIALRFAVRSVIGKANLIRTRLEFGDEFLWREGHGLAQLANPGELAITLPHGA
jgi:hypothetical protein